MTTPELVHRATASGRAYRDLPIHAADGVHEYALELVSSTGPGQRVLDVGSGSGALAQRLHDAGFQVTASDLDPTDYWAAPPAYAWDAAGREVPEALGSGFDVVAAIEVLEHVENPLQALRNFHDLLRPGGLLVASTPHVGHPRSRLKFLVQGTPSYFGPREFFASGHRTLLPDWALELHAKAAGFTDVSVSYAGSLGLPPAQRLAYSAILPAFLLSGQMPTPRRQDGCITFVTGRKPSA